MTGWVSDYKVEQWLSELADCYVGLHFDDPRTAGAYASEFFGGSYIRSKATFSYPANRATWNTTAISFYGLPAGMGTHLSIWDSLTNGNLVLAATVPGGARRIIAGGRFDLGINEFAVSVP